ncbi:MAG: cation:proton antiporter [Oscillospiraceae bacterium]|nr:cation:proton antiporter [Oscillospiraceae bacterium]
MQIEVFKDLAIIILFAKLFGLLAKKLKAPQVVGEIIAGLIIGPSVLGLVGQSDFISQMAEIGVLLLMFSAGLETDLKDLLKTGPVALVIACAGVGVPLLGGYLLYSGLVLGGFAEVGTTQFYTAIFVGVIMTATSVGITVQALRELGKLKGKIGTLILSAAIIDDVIGIIVLTFVIGMSSSASGGSSNSGALDVIIKTVLFFAFSIGVGFVIYKIFKMIDKKYPHQRRIPILGLCLCFAMSYIAEEFFGIADITGAYVAGIILCNLKDSDYIAEKMDISSYMLFGPVFFASIGLKTEFSNFSSDIVIFSICFVLVALVTKIIGCGGISRLFGYKGKDCLKIGVGMMTRGEVALIVSQKGLAVGLLNSTYFAAVILLIICSSVATPILLKLLYKGEDDDTPAAVPAETAKS